MSDSFSLNLSEPDPGDEGGDNGYFNPEGVADSAPNPLEALIAKEEAEESLG